LFTDNAVVRRLRRVVVVAGIEPVHKAKVSGYRATLGERSGNASLEKFSYDSDPPTGSRLRLHLTIDQSFKDRLAQAKKTTAAGGQWSPISPTPAPALTSGRDGVWNVGEADLAAILQDGAQFVTHDNHGYVQQMTLEATQCGTSSVAPTTTTTTTTPADLSDLSAIDLLPFPADWNVELTDFDVNADFSPLTDIHPQVPGFGSVFLPMGTDFVANDQSGFFGSQLPISSELFPVYDDVIGAWAVGDDVPMFDDVGLLWSTPSIGHAISVQ